VAKNFHGNGVERTSISSKTNLQLIGASALPNKIRDASAFAVPLLITISGPVLPELGHDGLAGVVVQPTLPIALPVPLTNSIQPYRCVPTVGGVDELDAPPEPKETRNVFELVTKLRVITILPLASRKVQRIPVPADPGAFQ
jgi:hypothetical protein